MKVKCYHCKGTYRLYGDMMHHPTANICPFCGEEIRRSVWEHCVLPAWGLMEDTNRDLQQEYTGYPDTQLFQIEYQTNKPRVHKAMTDYNPYKDCPNID